MEKERRTKETAETVETVETVETQTPEQDKARRVLRARLPKLSEAGLNFEKRTGNFFKATLEKATEKTQDAAGNEVDKLDANGNPVYVMDPRTGTAVEKVRRTVVEIEDECGELLPEFAGLADEVEAKRAAALVAGSDATREKLEKAIDFANQALRDAEKAKSRFDSQYSKALAVLDAFELPETTRATRMSASLRLAAIEDENAKLRAKLIAAGFDPYEL